MKAIPIAEFDLLVLTVTKLQARVKALEEWQEQKQHEEDSEYESEMEHVPGG